MTQKTDDQTLLREIRAENVFAFNELLQKYEGFLKFRAYKELKDPELIEEVVLDVMLSIWQKRMTLHINKTLIAYLCGAIKKACYKKIRDQKKYKMTILYIDYPEKEYGYQPHCTAENKDLLEMIYESVSKISNPFNKQAFVWYYLHNKSQKEISVEMNVSPGTTSMRIHRALKEVRAYLRDVYNAPFFS